RENFFDGADLLRLVVDDEVPFVTEFVDVLAENADAERMKGADRGTTVVPGSGLRVPGSGNQLADPFAHFARGFVGEGDGEDVSWRNTFGDQPGDAAGDDARFAGARAGQDQDRALQRFHRETLLRVERIQVQHRCECKSQSRRIEIFSRNLKI